MQKRHLNNGAGNKIKQILLGNALDKQLRLYPNGRSITMHAVAVLQPLPAFPLFDDGQALKILDHLFLHKVWSGAAEDSVEIGGLLACPEGMYWDAAAGWQRVSVIQCPAFLLPD